MHGFQGQDKTAVCPKSLTHFVLFWFSTKQTAFQDDDADVSV